jgi:hypothetical protein
LRAPLHFLLKYLQFVIHDRFFLLHRRRAVLYASLEGFVRLLRVVATLGGTVEGFFL